MSLEGRVALITGGDRGIGKGIALALAQEGADIAIYYRKDTKAAEEAVAEIESLGRRGLAFQVDISDYERLNEAVATVVKTLGKVDILINNAGIVSRGNFVADTGIEELQRVFSVNAFGPFMLTKLVLPYMRQQPRGDIIFISSDITITCAPGTAPYAMTKAALEILAKCLAMEERPYGIRVNVIAPSVVETEMGRRLVKGTRGVENIKDLYPVAPFNRVAQPYDIGNLCAFLVSEKGSYISGQVIFVNAGISYFNLPNP